MMVYLTRTTRPVSECARVVPILPETGLRASRSSRRSTLEHRTHVPRVGIITRGSKFVMRRPPPGWLVIGSNFGFGVNILHPRAFCAMLLSTKYAEGSGRMPPSPPHGTRVRWVCVCVTDRGRGHHPIFGCFSGAMLGYRPGGLWASPRECVARTRTFSFYQQAAGANGPAVFFDRAADANSTLSARRRQPTASGAAGAADSSPTARAPHPDSPAALCARPYSR